MSTIMWLYSLDTDRVYSLSGVGADMWLVLSAWGTPDGDVTGDGTTGVADVLALLAAWGDC